jgi:hypothetical protein
MSAIEKTKATDIPLPSERSFGLVMAVFFAIIGIYPLWKGNEMRVWSLIIAGIFFFLAFVLPKALRPLNLLWFKFGLLLNRIVSPLLMGIVFYFIVTPMGLIMKLLGKDLIGLKLDKNAKTYWIEREPPGPGKESFENQF